ncbi:MAG: FmdB family zinc ribbon protein [Actinomycetota bacterium]
MPTYEYVCRSCGHLFEIVMSMRDDPLTECPECGGELRKVFAPPAISFKGSGFYATDQRKKARSTDEKTGQETGEKTGDSGKKEDAGGPETKPETKKKDAATSPASAPKKPSSASSTSPTKEGGSS